ncbi:hypothetical protein [Nostoc sp.]
MFRKNVVMLVSDRTTHKSTLHNVTASDLAKLCVPQRLMMR